MDDTTTLGKILTDRIKNSLMISCWTPDILRRIQKEESKYPDHKMTYLGIKEGKRFFRLTYPIRFRNREVEQAVGGQHLVVVNATTKEIESASVSLFIAGKINPYHSYTLFLSGNIKSPNLCSPKFQSPLE